MSTIVNRAAKGTPLTNNEVDANFTNLNTDKVETVSSSNGTILFTKTGTDINLQVSPDFPAATLLASVRNETGSTLTKGTVVYISGASGNKCLVARAIATAESTSSKTFGMISEDISSNQNGSVTISGVITGLDTSAFADGTTLYLSPSTAGAYTSTKPSAPNHMVYVGVVTRSHATQGAIQTRIQNGYELDEIHDVAISGVAQNDFLVRNGINLWVNQTPTTARASMGLGSAALNNTEDFDAAGVAIAMAIALG
jgi:ribosomal protein L35AE/L33A